MEHLFLWNKRKAWRVMPAEVSGSGPWRSFPTNSATPPPLTCEKSRQLSSCPAFSHASSTPSFLTRAFPFRPRSNRRRSRPAYPGKDGICVGDPDGARTGGEKTRGRASWYAIGFRGRDAGCGGVDPGGGMRPLLRGRGGLENGGMDVRSRVFEAGGPCLIPTPSHSGTGAVVGVM